MLTFGWWRDEDGEDQLITVSTKRDRISGACPSGILVYTARAGKQIAQASSDAYANVREDMVPSARECTSEVRPLVGRISSETL